MQTTLSVSRSQSGFTLIELLITLGIMLLLVGGGIAAFIRFNDRQTVLAAAKELQSYLRSGQQKAQVMDKPEGCDTLLGYRVTAPAAAPVVVTLTADCATDDIVRQTATLPSSVSLTAPLDMTFRVLQGGIEPAQTMTLTGSTGESYQFSISRGGEIGEGSFVE